MSDALSNVYGSIDEQFAGESALTRRKLVGGAAATLGGLGLLGLPDLADARRRRKKPKKKSLGPNTPQNILNVAASAEVLATIINTVGAEQVALDPVTKRNVQAAAREELIHFNVLSNLGGKPATKGSVWIPDKVFSSPTNFLSTVIVGDQIFINAYLIATTSFASVGNSKFARIAAEFMGAEAVHRAVARQSLGLLGNDRVFIKYNQREEADGPGQGGSGFTNILDAVKQLQAAGIGFGTKGAEPGRFYDFDKVKVRTPNPSDVNTRLPA